MSLISANTLFHFTPKFDWLNSILEKGFVPRLSREFYEGNVITRENPNGDLVPMVCFCDIPLSQLRNHIGLYGNYGIGLEKDWGIEKGLSPVFYLTKTSQFVEDYQRIRKDSTDLIFDLYFLAKNGRPRMPLEQRSIETQSKDSNDLVYLASQILNKFMALSHLEKYYKPYIGRFEKGKKVFDNYCYYNEREWRFNPSFKNNSDLTIPPYVIESALRSNGNNPELKTFLENHFGRLISQGVSDDELLVGHFTPSIFSYLPKRDIRNEINDSLLRSPRFHLTFDLNRVKYIILKNDKEINRFIKNLVRLRKSQPGKFVKEEVDLLTTKIITCKQINEDF